MKFVKEIFEIGKISFKRETKGRRKLYFKLNHLVVTSLMAVFSFVATFLSIGMGKEKVEASSVDNDITKSENVDKAVYNKKEIEVNYGQNKKIAEVAREILNDKVSKANVLKEVKKEGNTSFYSLGDYDIKLEADGKNGNELVDMSISSKTNTDKDTGVKMLNSGNKKVSDYVDDNYKIKVKYVDTIAPNIEFTADKVEINPTDDFDAKKYIKNITDNKDGNIKDFSVDAKDLKKNANGSYSEGEYVVTITTTDASGNQAKKDLKVVVTSDADIDDEATANNDLEETTTTQTTDVKEYQGASAVLDAAYAQIGVNQDCTALVSNALAAAGIYFHGWPADYMSLGTVVPADEAKPGDIIYYADGGAGCAHVAIYAGNGKAVHGGYMGTTVLSSAYVGSGPVFIRVGN